ncbi:MAG: quinone-dependent dihydroorotate dehydrogenase [Verrucomicrobiales bacterium]|jgi:dihydroorotate dehydrogenase|nr:quinone-dependent dihydroorotate dehydrogenase [Verrucomicrobiales bacterium]
MIYERILRPLLFKTTDAEFIHGVAAFILQHNPALPLIAPLLRADDEPVQLWRLKFRNRLGLAAGFDKEAALVKAFWRLGFGHTEIGTVTRHAQPGNPKPRVFRCPREGGLVNRMGFPNSGADAIADRLTRLRLAWGKPDYPIGVNIGKSKITELADAAGDYLYSFKKLHAVGDYFVVNVSSPNTPGLRNLQSVEALRPILSTLQAANRELGEKPLLLKIAPDLNYADIAGLLALIAGQGLHGIVATNTTLDHRAITLTETGGLSGRPLTVKSTEIIKFIAKETGGKLPIIGVGGVFTRADYQEKLDAGASLVQLYTGFIYRGPFAARKILRGR